MIVFFAVGYFGIDYLLKSRSLAYTSSRSDLTFKHPAGWKKLNASELTRLSGMADVNLYNEVLLADSTGNDLKYLLGAGSVAMAPEQWEFKKSELRSQFTGDTTGTIPQGTFGINGGTATDATIGGASALDAKFKMNSLGYEFNCRVVVISHRTTMYMLLSMTRVDEGGAPAQEQKVVDSIEFKK